MCRAYEDVDIDYEYERYRDDEYIAELEARRKAKKGDEDDI